MNRAVHGRDGQPGIRVLAVVGGELAADDEWALLDALVAINGPKRPEVRVIALVHGTGPLFVLGSLPGQVISIMPSPDGAGSSGCHPADSARHRLARALRYLHGLGLRASGDIEPGGTYRAVRQAIAAGGYGRVFLLPGNRSTWLHRMAFRLIAARLRHSLHLLVVVPGRTSLSASAAQIAPVPALPDVHPAHRPRQAMTLTFSAWGPFWPWVMSSSTFCPSSRLR